MAADHGRFKEFRTFLQQGKFPLFFLLSCESCKEACNGILGCIFERMVPHGDAGSDLRASHLVLFLFPKLSACLMFRSAMTAARVVSAKSFEANFAVEHRCSSRFHIY